MGRRRHIPPFETEITHLGERGVGMGTTPDGLPVAVRGAPPGSRIRVLPAGLRKGRWNGRRQAMIRPPAGYVTPKCAQFGLCGGCVLQELDAPSQTAAKHALALAPMQPIDPAVTVHPARSTGVLYGYRNKVELSFGTARYLSEADHAEGLPLDGRFLGFHAQGRFDRVVDTPRCELISDPLNAVLTAVRSVALHADAPPPKHARTHEGFWRHLVLREGSVTGERLVIVHTRDPAVAEAQAPDGAAWVAKVAEAALAAPQADGGRVVGVVWRVEEGVADVARGEVRHVWGQDHLHERLGALTVRVGPDTFFQTHTAGAALLYDTVGEALGEVGELETLIDLYCGAGTIGLYLAHKAPHLFGIEVVPQAVASAQANAAAMGHPSARYVASKVEDALHELAHLAGPRALVVDPPRVGLHPKVATALATAEAEVLVYVACKPASLARDAAVLAQGHWRLAALWPVDLFPQTGHVELVARFERTTD